MRALALALGLVCAWSTLARAAPKEEDRPTVAILYFDYDGKDESMAVLRKGLAQMLISDLAAMDSVRFVERERLEAILAELKLGESKKIDPKTAAKVGKLLGARYLVLGNYFDLMGSLRIDARVVEVETGRIVQSVGSHGKPDDFMPLEQKLATDLGAVLAKDLKIAVAAPKPPRAKPPAKMPTKTAVMYANALNEIDRGDRVKAKEMLQEVVKQQPDFQLAALDLDKMMQ